MTIEKVVGVTRFDMSLEPPERSVIAIDNTDYELATPDDYSIPELRAINRMWKEITAWAESDSLTVKQGKDYDKNIDALLKYACPSLPAELLKNTNFTRSKKSAIVTTFFLEAMKKPPMTRRGDSDTQSADYTDFMVGI